MAPETEAERRRRPSRSSDSRGAGAGILSSEKGSRMIVKLRGGQTLKGLLKRVGREELVLDVEGMELIVFRQAIDVVQPLRGGDAQSS